MFKKIMMICITLAFPVIMLFVYYYTTNIFTPKLQLAWNFFLVFFGFFAAIALVIKTLSLFVADDDPYNRRY